MREISSRRFSCLPQDHSTLLGSLKLRESKTIPLGGSKVQQEDFMPSLVPPGLSPGWMKSGL